MNQYVGIKTYRKFDLANCLALILCISMYSLTCASSKHSCNEGHFKLLWTYSIFFYVRKSQILETRFLTLTPKLCGPFYCGFCFFFFMYLFEHCYIFLVHSYHAVYPVSYNASTIFLEKHVIPNECYKISSFVWIKLVCWKVFYVHFDLMLI